MASRPLTIGYVNPEYGSQRNIIGKCSEWEYVRVRSFASLGHKVLCRIGLAEKGRPPYFFIGGVPEGMCHIDLLHFWNSVCLPPSRRPYVTSFETTVPRAFSNGRMIAQGLKSLLSKQCRKLIAISEHARARQIAFDAEYGISELDEKLTVLHPPQEVLCNDIDLATRNRDCRNGMRFIFVGKDFFRKGGAEVARALIEVRKDFPVEAFVIGNYEYVDYASSWEVDSAEEMRKLFSDNESWLHHFKFLPNPKVVELAKTCQIGLLPTRDDTFGYSVLEFQACGLPCITTDIRALPEVNNDGIGWLVNVPRLPNGCADFSTTEKMRELSRTIENGLVEKSREALSSPESIAAKGVRALNNIKANHSPETCGRHLGEIYEGAIG